MASGRSIPHDSPRQDTTWTWWHTLTFTHSHSETVRYIFLVTFCLLSVHAEEHISCMTLSFFAAYTDIMNHLLSQLLTHTHTSFSGISQMFWSWLTNQKWACMSEPHFTLGQVEYVTGGSTDWGWKAHIQLHNVRDCAHLNVSQFYHFETIAPENVHLCMCNEHCAQFKCN